MSKLEELFQRVSEYQNGSQVAKRMTQLWDMAIEQGDTSIPERVMQVIEAWEEKLLQRTQLDMFQNKAVLPNFGQALKDSTDEEWAEFKKIHEIKPLELNFDNNRLFGDAGGNVKNTGFEEWVLGIEDGSASAEHKTNIHKDIQEDRRSKE